MDAFLLEPDFVVSPLGDLMPGPLYIENGFIAHIGFKSGFENIKKIKLPGKMLFPGFINTHSHALQRALRGRIEKKKLHETYNDFWSWRHAMYQDVLAFDLDAIEAIASWCYLDMVKAGFVAVAEFNYVHHHQNGKHYLDPSAVSRRLQSAAKKTGIRLILLQTAYARNNFKEKALPEQRRFVFKEAAAFLDFTRAIQSQLNDDSIAHGLAIHSVRSCPEDWIQMVSQEAQRLRLPLHIHACEQKSEVESCFEEHGITPIALLKRCQALSPTTTLIHATHITQDDIEMIAQEGSLVSLCPSTEKNLGDGLCPVIDLQKSNIPLCLGTDQHVRLDIADELRAIEENERLRLRRRLVLTKPGDFLANALIPIATFFGRKSVFLKESPNLIGLPADLTAVQIPIEGHLNGHRIAVDAWLMAGNSSSITDVFVAGKQIVQDGVHPNEQEILANILSVFSVSGREPVL